MRVLILTCALALIHGGAVAAQRPLPPTSYERTVTSQVAGAARLALDSALIVRASPFTPGGGPGDLRFHDASGKEVPYLFVWPSEEAPAWRNGRTIPVSPGKDTSGFEVDLGHIATVDEVEIPGLPETFLKRVRLDGSGDRTRWTVLVAEGTLFNLPNESSAGRTLRQTQLAFTPGAYRYLRLIWDDHAGRRLPTPSTARARIAPRHARATDTLRMQLGVEKRPSAARSSRYHIRLPANRLPISALELDVGGSQVLRTASVTEPRLGNGRVAPAQLGTTMLRRTADAGAVASDLRIPIAAPTGEELDVVIDDEDNPPLDVRGIRAIFAPLPYVFFENSNGAELRATYGTERREAIAPPRYDLEALRDTVMDIATSTAAWGAPRETRTATAPATPSALYAAPGAPLDVKTFTYVRPIPDGSGLTALRVDAAALAHGHLDDLRIVDGEGRQVPYLLELLDEPTELALPALEPIASPKGATRSSYRLRLPYAGLPDASLRLSTSARVFRRDVSIVIREPRRDAVSDEGVDRAANGSWTHGDPESAAPSLEIPLGRRVRADSLVVIVNDGDNQKLPLETPTLLLPSYRLRFFREPNAPLRLVYGRSDLGAPRYDIELIAPRLLDAPAEEVAVKPEGAGPAGLGRTPQIVFWSVLGAVVVALLLLIARLVRNA